MPRRDENRLGVESEFFCRVSLDRGNSRPRQALRAPSIPTATAGRMPTERRSDIPHGLDTCGPHVGGQCGSVEQGSLNGLSRVAATASLLFTISSLGAIVKSLFRDRDNLHQKSQVNMRTLVEVMAVDSSPRAGAETGEADSTARESRPTPGCLRWNSL